MGVDIHAFVEVDYVSGGVPFTDADGIRAFNTGEFFAWRNGALFDALGDLATGWPAAGIYPSASKRALYTPRGLPSPVSRCIEDRYYLRVVEPWLTPKEVHASLDHASLRVADLHIEVRVMLEAMALFEQSLGEGRSRLIVWFDN